MALDVNLLYTYSQDLRGNSQNVTNHFSQLHRHIQRLFFMPEKINNYITRISVKVKCNYLEHHLSYALGTSENLCNYVM